MSRTRSLLCLLVLAAVPAVAGCRPATLRPGNLAPGYRGGPQPGSALAPVTDPARFTTGPFQGCPPAGDGGDPDLNRLKNRDVAPPVYQSLTVADLVANHPDEAESAGRSPRSAWPAAAREQVRDWERSGVAVEGYLLEARQEGPESCNCHAQDQRDYHLWLGAGPDADRSEAVVVEVSPRVRSRHDAWRLRILRRLARDRARVRVSGWLMWDQEHPEQVGRTRGTLWEIHPIHRIEVLSGGAWREL